MQEMMKGGTPGMHFLGKIIPLTYMMGHKATKNNYRVIMWGSIQIGHSERRLSPKLFIQII